MLWGVDKANAMRGILQEFAARLLRLQDAGFTADSEVFLNATALGDPFDEGPMPAISSVARSRLPRFARVL